jgi:hypothetical protein
VFYYLDTRAARAPPWPCDSAGCCIYPDSLALNRDSRVPRTMADTLKTFREIFGLLDCGLVLCRSE